MWLGITVNNVQGPNWYGSHDNVRFEFEGLWDPHKRPHSNKIAGGSMTDVMETPSFEVLGVKGVLVDTIYSVANAHVSKLEGEAE